MNLTTQVQRLSLLSSSPPSTSYTVAPPPSHPPVEPQLPLPEHFAGDPEDCSPFISQCFLISAFQPSAFPMEESRIAYMISLLTGQACHWGTAEWEHESFVCSLVKSFTDALRKVFEDSTILKDQGAWSITLWIFRPAWSNWNQGLLVDIFYQGSSPQVKDEQAARDPPEGLDDLISLATHLDWLLRAPAPSEPGRYVFTFFIQPWLPALLASHDPGPHRSVCHHHPWLKPLSPFNWGEPS